MDSELEFQIPSHKKKKIPVLNGLQKFEKSFGFIGELLYAKIPVAKIFGDLIFNSNL